MPGEMGLVNTCGAEERLTRRVAKKLTNRASDLAIGHLVDAVVGQRTPVEVVIGRAELIEVSEIEKPVQRSIVRERIRDICPELVLQMSAVFKVLPICAVRAFTTS